ncbi:MAG: hypothetical protein JO253_08305, partial [Alphaproteobacteria bacterium]|nr:hypothetical protein [Alphaproteobacteria bacterium]
MLTVSDQAMAQGMPVFDASSFGQLLKEIINDARRELQLAFGHSGGIAGQQLASLMNMQGQNTMMADSHRIAEAQTQAKIIADNTMMQDKSYCYPIMATITWDQVEASLGQVQNAVRKAIEAAAIDRGTVNGTAAFNGLVTTAKMTPKQDCAANQSCQTSYDDHAIYNPGTVVTPRGYLWPKNISVKPVGQNGEQVVTFTTGDSNDAPGDAALLYCLNNMPGATTLLLKVSDKDDQAYQSCVRGQVSAAERAIDKCVTEAAERMQIGPNVSGSGMQQVRQAYLSMCTYLHGAKNKYQAITDQQFSDCQSKGVSYLELRKYYACQYSGSLDNMNDTARGGGG